MITNGVHNPTRYRFEMRQLCNQHEAGAHTLAPIAECPLCLAGKGEPVPVIAMRVLEDGIQRTQAGNVCRISKHRSPIIAGVEHERLRCADARAGRQS